MKCPIYFVLGNHDYHERTFASVHDDLHRLMRRHPNLHWMTERGVISLSEEVALIGTEGWYDARFGNPSLLRYTTDWFRTHDFLAMPDMATRLIAFRNLAAKSALHVEEYLTKALETHKTVYLLTHVPPWPEATRDVGTVLEPFWLPYNTNAILGETIERVMHGRKKRHLTVLAGHTHTQCWVHVARNIECRVNKARYYGQPSCEESLVLP